MSRREVRRSRSRRVKGGRQGSEDAARHLEGQRQVLEHGQALEDVRRLELAADAQASDRSARAGGSGRGVRRRRLVIQTLPVCGRVLPVMTSRSVVLPAPLGPMTTRSSPRRREKFRLLMALKPLKVTVRSSTSRSFPSVGVIVARLA